MINLISLLTCIFAITFCSPSSEIKYSIIFQNYKCNDKPLEAAGFIIKKDNGSVQRTIENGRLYLRPEKNKLFIAVKQFSPALEIDSVRIYWGVDSFPKDANWDEGIKREAICVGITMDTDWKPKKEYIVPILNIGKCPSLPSFLLVLTENKPNKRYYKGNVCKAANRFGCTHYNKNIGSITKSIISVKQDFKNAFGVDLDGPIVAVTIEIDARGLKGKVESFIERIDFVGN
jgi:hypothetical protein